MEMSHAFLGIALMLAPGVGLGSPEAPIAGTPDTTKTIDLLSGALSTTAAEELEARLAKAPDDLEARIQLLVYYDKVRHTDESAESRRIPHVIWVIKNRPEAPIAGLGNYCALKPDIDGATVYNAARSSWLGRVGEGQTNTTLIWNAANFFFGSEETTLIALCRRGQALEPKNPRWPDKIGFRHELDALFARDKAQSYTKASLALKEYENALKLTLLKNDQVWLYDRLAVLYFLIGRDDKASKYANALLTDIPVNDMQYGMGVHNGRTILGLIAVKNGDIGKAREHLNESVNITKSSAPPWPYMDLAKALLEKGQKDAVLEYLELCGKNWEVPGVKDQLAEWADQIRKGMTPDFFGYLWINIGNQGK